MGFPGGSVVKNLPTSAGDTGSIPGLRRSPGGGNGNPLQYSCLRNPMNRGAWRATSVGLHLCAHAHTHTHIHTHTLLLMVEAAVMVGNAIVSHFIDEFVWIPSQS